MLLLCPYVYLGSRHRTSVLHILSLCQSYFYSVVKQHALGQKNKLLACILKERLPPLGSGTSILIHGAASRAILAQTLLTIVVVDEEGDEKYCCEYH